MDTLMYLSTPVLFLVLYITSQYFYHKLKNHPPSPFPVLPFIGHMYMLKKPFHRSLSEISKKYGPIIFLKLGSRPILLISSPSLAEECFTKHDIIFANRPSFLNGKHYGYNYTGLPWCSYTDHWRNLRKIATIELLSSTRLQTLSHVRKDEILIMIRKLFQLSKDKSDRVVHVKVALFEFMFNYYGKNVESSKEAKIFQEIVNESSLVGPATNVVDFLPFMKWFGYKDTEKTIMSIQEKRDKYMQNLIDEHRNIMESDASSDDNANGEKENKIMAQILLSFQKQEPEYYTDEMIKNLLLVLIQAGSNSSADTLEWAFSLLLDNPDVLTRAQAEIDNVVGRERLINESDLTQLPYLCGIINETLRLHPAGPLLLPHESSKECTVGGFLVPKGTILLVNVWDIHHSSKLWEDPEKFKPERFQDYEEGKSERKFMPFGHGRRACPGENLALRNVIMALGSLIQCFDWEKVSEIDMNEATGITAPKIKPLTTKCNPRPFVDKLLSVI
ncbi:hypothetical protein ACJIZ3_025043 [Penstemon smallii]|uniref:Flavonoid-6-hydroxylase n=1 Tax=Penstemon smallii TaxID=265156 RepID=A0ABD3TTP3_9LAMI